jgi:single-stranded DNA-binding protein
MSNGITFSGTAEFQRLSLRQTKQGKEIVSIIVKFMDGEYTQFVPITVFGSLEFTARALEPGEIVEVSGQLRGREWQDKVFGESVAKTLTVKGEKKKGAGNHSEVHAGADGKGVDDDVPF